MMGAVGSDDPFDTGLPPGEPYVPRNVSASNAYVTGGKRANIGSPPPLPPWG